MPNTATRRTLSTLLTAEMLSMSFVLLTFGGPVFVLFLDELQLGTQQIGILLSLVPFCGIVAPFIAPLVGRFGHKRIYVTFWGIRKVAFALILFTPAIIQRYGTESAFWWVALFSPLPYAVPLPKQGDSNGKKGLCPMPSGGNTALSTA